MNLLVVAFSLSTIAVSGCLSTLFTGQQMPSSDDSTQTNLTPKPNLMTSLDNKMPKAVRSLIADLNATSPSPIVGSDEDDRAVAIPFFVEGVEGGEITGDGGGNSDAMGRVIAAQTTPEFKIVYPSPSPSACIHFADSGPCRASMPRWFYDSVRGRCRRFIYGGCNGNGNNFYTERECVRMCAGILRSGPLLTSQNVTDQVLLATTTTSHIDTSKSNALLGETTFAFWFGAQRKRVQAPS